MIAVPACLVALAGLTGCGDDSPVEETEVVVTQEVGKVDVKNLTPAKVKPVAQAPKFTGEPKAVASDIDKIVAAINDDDGKYLCENGYSKTDIEIIDANGGCEAFAKQLLAGYLGYRLEIKEIKIKGDTAKVLAQVVTYDKKLEDPFVRDIPMRFVKENGQWRMFLNLKQKTEEAPPSDSVGSIEDDPRTPQNESTEPPPE